MSLDFLEQDDQGFKAVIDLALYTNTAVKKAAHKFTNDCFVHLESSDIPSKLNATFISKSTTVNLKTIAGLFFNELLDQSLREKIGTESEPIRNLIMAHALSKVDFISMESKLESTAENPL
jgi:His-Xaa-Ser system protein HxsD